MPTWSPGAGPSNGNDVFSGESTADVADALGGDDVLSGFGGGDTLSGGDGDDIIYGYAAGASSAIDSTVLVSGLATPVAGATTAADPGFLYIVEKDTGIIWRVNAATGAKTQFLDIPDNQFLHDGERGVLGLAFHPDYDTNGRFFVYLTDAEGDIQIREFHRSAGDPLVADPSSTLVIEVPHPTFANHNGGWLGFSPVDGYLYFGAGDGGSGGDPNNNAQNLDILLGKIIRIDVNSDAFPADATRNYAIPASNPFVGVAGADEIWAYGVRNPWRMAFDPRNGDLYVGDVGQSTREEVDYIAAGHGGANLGWRIMEGNVPFNPGPPGTPQPGDPSLTLPIYDYGRDVGTTITGGEIYTGSVTGFVGQYVFADYGSGRFFSLSVTDGAAVDATDRTTQLTGSIPSAVVDFVTDNNGALYAIGIGGTIWRLDPGAGAADGADTLNGDAGNDTLIGGAGADTLNGGAGMDLASYADSAAGVTVNLATGTGSGGDAQGDTLVSIENLVGSAFVDILTGNAVANTLDGGAGADTMSGGLGDDTYFVDNGGDVVTENVGEGADTINSSVGIAALAANVENLVLLGTAVTGNGNGLDNSITGNAQNNSINGAAGADAMIGGLGNDTYFVDNAGDVVTELSGQGTDTIFSTLSLTLPANVENLTLSGTALNATGNFLNNVLTGDAQKNVLNGGSGEDTLAGGLDSDTYIYNSAGDTITEAVNAGLSDTVIAFINVGALMANVENVTLAGSAVSAVGNELNNILTGNGLDNTLTGGLGNDQLNGAVGADTLIGGQGDDAYLVENSGDVVTENANEGNDVVYTWVTLPSLFDNVERATIIGAGNLDITGNGLDNRLYGNDQNNTLAGVGGEDIIGGLGGDDHIVGGAGRDLLTGGAGADTFVYQSISDSGTSGASRDIIYDFTQGQDHIDVSAIDANTITGGVQHFSFVGTNAFTNTAGELRYDLIDNPTGTDYTIISMDVNGDGVADSQITLVGLITLGQGDLIFGGP